MAAVFAEEDRVRGALASREKAISIAAINGPKHVVIRGLPMRSPGSKIWRLKALRRRGCRCRMPSIPR